MSIPITVFLIDLALRLILAVRIIMSPRGVAAALAWLLLLFIPVPFLGVAIYLALGEIRLGGSRLARYRALTSDFNTKTQVFWRGLSQEWSTDTAPYKAVANVLTQVGEIPPLRGNTIEYVPGSEAFITRLIHDIDHATHRVHLLFFIWMHTGMGLDLVAAVERAAKRGVECRVLVDAHGSKDFLRAGLDQRLRNAGAHAAAALPVNPLRMLLHRIDLRNHRKIAAIDGSIAWTGSSNITDDSFGYKPIRRVGPWIEAMARVTGPAAQALDAVFLRDWKVESGQHDHDMLDRLMPRQPVPDTGCTVHVVPTGPDTGPLTMRDALIAAIFSAQDELIMTTPYFVPDAATKEALILAAARGVQVKIVVPRHLDQLIVGAASRAHFPSLLNAGVRIYLHRVGLLHSKTITIDADIAMIGSHNFDNRSFMLNFETSLFVYDSDQASMLRMLQTQYLGESDEIFLEQWEQRPLWKRFAEKCARLLGPLL